MVCIYISTTPGTVSALKISFRHLLASPGKVTLKFFPLPLAGQKSKISLLCLCPAKEFREVSLCHPAELRLPRLLPAHSGWEMHPFLFSAVRPKRNFASVHPEPSGFPHRGSPVLRSICHIPGQILPARVWHPGRPCASLPPQPVVTSGGSKRSPRSVLGWKRTCFVCYL